MNNIYTSSKRIAFKISAIAQVSNFNCFSKPVLVVLLYIPVFSWKYSQMNTILIVSSSQ